jgi:hypothetical protein
MLATSDNIKLYPNPVNTTLNIDILEGQFDEVNVYSAMGDLVLSYKNVSGSMQMDVSQLATGMYFVRFVTGKLAVSKRFIKR